MDGADKYWPVKFTCPWCGAEQVHRVRGVPISTRISIDHYCRLHTCGKIAHLACEMTRDGFYLLVVEKGTIEVKAISFRGRRKRR